MEAGGDLEFFQRSTAEANKCSRPIESPTSGSSQQHLVKAKLPKLEVKKFSGNFQDWQEFWDSFQSSIDGNESLSAVDKFSYLKSLLYEPARSTIAGFALTGANYAAAVQVLKKRYGKEIAIQRAHIYDLLQLPPVSSDRDIPRLRKLFDDCEAHFRGLQALGVDENTYSSVVVPAMMQKLQDNFRLTITSGEEILTWSMEMLEAFLKELDLREDHFYAANPSKIGKENRLKGGTANALHTKQDELNTASALLAKMNDFCAYCKGGRAHQYCTIVKSVEERRQLLRRYGRCFICARKGQISRDCNSKLTCSMCKGKHHVSICYQSNITNGDQFSRAHNGDCNGSLNSDRASNACPSHTGKPGGNNGQQA